MIIEGFALQNLMLRLRFFSLKGFAHVLELFYGHIDGQIKDIDGKTVQSLGGVVEP